MKKLLFLLFIPVFAMSQTTQWRWTVDLSTQTRQDTVLQPLSFSDIAGYGWTATYYLSGLDTSVRIDIGGSNFKIDSLTHRMAFEGLVSSDTLPYRLYQDSLMIITNDDTTYQKSFSGEPYAYGFQWPMNKLLKDSATTGTVIGVMKFFKR